MIFILCIVMFLHHNESLILSLLNPSFYRSIFLFVYLRLFNPGSSIVRETLVDLPDRVPWILSDFSAQTPPWITTFWLRCSRACLNTQLGLWNQFLEKGYHGWEAAGRGKYIFTPLVTCMVSTSNTTWAMIVWPGGMWLGGMAYPVWIPVTYELTTQQ